jgi:ElaB/YqjD/DUF883 family membrane-anchored ribosome-binding protein
MESSMKAPGKQAEAPADTATDRAQAMGKRGLDAVTEAAGRARDTVSSASQSVIDYTRENPVKALTIAAVSGALLVTIAKAIRASRD